MTLIEKVKAVLFSPSMFFQRIKAEVEIIEAFKYLIILSIVYIVMSFVSTFLFYYLLSSIFYGMGYYPYTSMMPMYGIPGIFSFIMYGFIFVALIIGPFITAAIMHVLTKIFGGKNDFSATYKVTVYSMTPTLIIGWMPYVGIFASFYAWYLYIKGLSILHDISIGRAFLVTLIPIIIIVMIVGALVFLFLTTIMTPIGMVPTGEIFSILSKYFGMY